MLSEALKNIQHSDFSLFDYVKMCSLPNQLYINVFEAIYKVLYKKDKNGLTKLIKRNISNTINLIDVSGRYTNTLRNDILFCPELLKFLKKNMFEGKQLYTSTDAFNASRQILTTNQRTKLLNILLKSNINMIPYIINSAQLSNMTEYNETTINITNIFDILIYNGQFKCKTITHYLSKK
jgi:hypothetical protein